MKVPFLTALFTLVLPLATIAQDIARDATQDGAWNEAPVARIVTQEQPPDECIAPVHIRKIDGEPVEVTPGGFELEPGPHSMNGVAVLDTRFCRPALGRNSQGVADLQADFEADNTYYVGLDYTDPDAANWKLVIWKTESGALDHNDSMPISPDSEPLQR